ncbi:hypothetical protein AYO41_01740 [Verrucomicrobia bacterium SCGC AG-212-E04]|nr:hypothetical protein AYO41_01740 [Verrucomicrobia bacterium SCGC AG-212-E04]
MSAAPQHANKPVRHHRLAARFRLGIHLGSFRFSAIHLLVALVILLISSPLLEKLQHGDLIETILLTIVLVSSVLAVGGNRRSVLLMSLLALPALFLKWFSQLRPDLISTSWFFAAAMFFCAFIVWRLLRFVLHCDRVNNEVLAASLTAYLMLGLVFAFAYMLAAQQNPRSFVFTTPGFTDEEMRGHNAIYFSYVTLSTVGYGDIVPVSPTVRTLAMSEAITGLLYIAVLVARLVALQTSSPPPPTVRDVDRDET